MHSKPTEVFIFKENSYVSIRTILTLGPPLGGEKWNITYINRLVLKWGGLIELFKHTAAQSLF